MATSLVAHEERDHAETVTDGTTDQRTGQSWYTIRVSVPPEQVARLGKVKLIPDMPVEAFVQTGDRTMLSYLIKPLRDQLMRAFREK